jgi:hypothetical protein
MQLECKSNVGAKQTPGQMMLSPVNVASPNLFPDLMGFSV